MIYGMTSQGYENGRMHANFTHVLRGKKTIFDKFSTIGKYFKKEYLLYSIASSRTTNNDTFFFVYYISIWTPNWQLPPTHIDSLTK